MRTFKIVGIIAIVAVIVFSTVTCASFGDIFKPAEFVIEMAEIQGGTFTMGFPESAVPQSQRGNRNDTEHKVTLTGFRMGKYQITQGQYQKVFGVNPSHFQTPVSPEKNTSNRPVEMVTWFDAVEFCNRLSTNQGLTPVYTITNRDPGYGRPIKGAMVTADWSANGYRLPTEAQWEYACRAGTTGMYNTGAEISNDTGWYRTNSENRTHGVGEKKANAWGLYDMHGNVYEWCWDWMGVFGREAQTDPTGEVSGNEKPVRGGSYNAAGADIRTPVRSSSKPGTLASYIGFRVVLPLQQGTGE